MAKPTEPELHYAGATDRGQQRTGNEDAFLANSRVLGVADGMGGHAAGEIASQTAVDTLTRIMRKRSKHDPAEALVAAVEEANQIIIERGQEYHQLAGMGTTVTAGAVRGDMLTIAHVGDSRAYLFRDGALTQLTQDHSLVAQMVRDGRITPDEAAVHPQRAVITRALGSTPDVEVDIVRQHLLPGDKIMFATDGLVGVLPDPMIARTLAKDAPIGDLCSRLVAQANARGGPDNITVVIAEFSGAPEGSGKKRTVYRPIIIVTLIFALLAGGAAYGVSRYLSGSYYLAFSGDTVALYQGLPGDIFGTKLSRVYRSTGIKREELPGYFQDRLAAGIPITGAEDADRVIQEILLSRRPEEQ